MNMDFVFYPARQSNVGEAFRACVRGESSSTIRKLLKNEMIESRKLLKDKQKSLSPALDECGRSPLHYAALGGRASVIQLLLEHDFDPNLQDEDGIFPLQIALAFDHYEAAEQLLLVTEPDLKDHKEQTAIFALASSSEDDKTEDSKMTELLSKMITLGHDIHAKDEYGRTALFKAVYADNVPMAEMLLKEGLDVNIVDTGHYSINYSPLSALTVAASYAGSEMVQLLVDHGANVNDVSRFHKGVHKGEISLTPLVLSIIHNEFEIAKILIDNGADLDIELPDEETIWDVIEEQKAQWSMTQGMERRESESDGDIDAFELYQQLVDNDFMNGSDSDSPDAELIIESGPEMRESGSSLRRNGISLTIESCSRPSMEGTEQNKIKQQHENLLQHMIDVEKQRKMRGLKGCMLMEELNVPDDLLRLIAHPLSW